jgi:hypothetical protein
LYNNGTWSYFCTIITTWTFLLVPFISLMFEIQPVKFGPEFALAASLYLFANFVVSLRRSLLLCKLNLLACRMLPLVHARWLAVPVCKLCGEQ